MIRNLEKRFLVVLVENEQRPDEILPTDREWSSKSTIVDSINLLISHHVPSQYGHCLRVTLRGHSLYFCARCSGIYGGLAISVPILIFLDMVTPGRLLQPSWLWFLIALALGFATVVDWTTQRITPRKTTVRARTLSGLASGLGLAIVFLLADLVYMLITLIVMVGSIGGVGFYEGRKSWKKTKETKPTQEANEQVTEQ